MESNEAKPSESLESQGAKEPESQTRAAKSGIFRTPKFFSAMKAGELRGVKDFGERKGTPFVFWDVLGNFRTRESIFRSETCEQSLR